MRVRAISGRLVQDLNAADANILRYIGYAFENGEWNWTNDLVVVDDCVDYRKAIQRGDLEFVPEMDDKIEKSRLKGGKIE